MNKYKTTVITKSIIKQITENGKKHIAVVGGGMSAEREVSLVSSSAVIEALVTLGYKVTFIDMGQDIAIALDNVKPDIVYNSLHGTYGEDGCLPGLLNIMRIPYTHSGVMSSSVAFCKLTSKILFGANDINIIPYYLIDKISLENNLNLITKPYVIKPLTQGSSLGIEIIFEGDNFDLSSYDFPYGDKILVERYIKGREMQVAILNGKALGVLEIKLLGKRFYDYETKYTEGFAEHICPAPISDIIYDQLLAQSEKAYNVLGCKGLARAEFIYNEEENKVYIIEINTHSGMTPLSICPEIAGLYKLSFTDLVEEILASASFET